MSLTPVFGHGPRPRAPISAKPRTRTVFQKPGTIIEDELDRAIAYAKLSLDPIMDKEQFAVALKLEATDADTKRAKTAAIRAALTPCWELVKGTSPALKLRHTLKSIRRTLSEFLGDKWLRQRVLTGCQVRNFKELRELIIRSKSLTEHLEPHSRLSDLATEIAALIKTPGENFTTRLLQFESAFEPYLAEVQGTNSKYQFGAYENDFQPPEGDRRLAPPTSAALADLKNAKESATSSMRNLWTALALLPLTRETRVTCEDEFIRHFGDLSPYTLAQNRYAFHEIVARREKASGSSPPSAKQAQSVRRISPDQLTANELADGLEKLHTVAMTRWSDKKRFNRDLAPRYSEFVKRAKGSTSGSSKKGREGTLAQFSGQEICRNCAINDPKAPLHFRSGCDEPLRKVARVARAISTVSLPGFNPEWEAGFEVP